MDRNRELEPIRATYDRAADQFDRSPLALWSWAGQRTVQRLELTPGKRVLDVCCGTGSTAIPAARAVGQFGTVLGVDLSAGLLDLARAKAAGLGLRNVEFRCADFTQLSFPWASCDAVVCQFGVFLLPDMVAGAARMWRLVAPGGVLAVTTWGTKVHEPVRGAFWDAVRRRRPDLHDDNPPVRQVGTPQRLRQLLLGAGVPDSEIGEEHRLMPLANAEDFWVTLMGSGNRRVIDALGSEAPAVKEEVSEFVDREGVTEVESIVLFATARRPGGES